MGERDVEDILWAKGNVEGAWQDKSIVEGTRKDRCDL
jgi:hypothetical protein